MRNENIDTVLTNKYISKLNTRRYLDNPIHTDLIILNLKTVIDNGSRNKGLR